MNRPPATYWWGFCGSTAAQTPVMTSSPALHMLRFSTPSLRRTHSGMLHNAWQISLRDHTQILQSSDSRRHFRPENCTARKNNNPDAQEMTETLFNK